jgi:hypothetical protein
VKWNNQNSLTRDQFYSLPGNTNNIQEALDNYADYVWDNSIPLSGGYVDKPDNRSSGPGKPPFWLSLDSDCGGQKGRTIHYSLFNQSGSRVSNYFVVQQESLAGRAEGSIFGPNTTHGNAGASTDGIFAGIGRPPSNSIQTFYVSQMLGDGGHGPLSQVLVYPQQNPTPHQTPWAGIGVYFSGTAQVYVQGTKGPALASCNPRY